MSNYSPYANFGYVSLIKESVEGTPITPTNFLRITAESVVPDFAISPVQEIAGSRERNIRSIADKVEIGGDIEFFVESKMIGHFLRSLFGAPITQTLTAAVAFRHTFEVTNTPLTYTIDIAPADAPWTHRFFGAFVNKIAIEPDENKIKCTASIAPRKAFISARVTTDVNSGTTLLVDQTAGLTNSDTIIVIQKEDGFTTIQELAITTVDSDTQLTVATISTTIDADDIVVIKRAVATYDQDKVFTWLGGAQISTGDDIDNTTVVSKESFTVEYLNETEARFFGGKEESARFAGDVLTKGFSANGQLTKFYDDELNLAKLRQNEKFGARVELCGETAIEANSAIQAKTFWGTGNGFEVESTAAGKAGNDFNVTFAINTSDVLAASILGNNITILLADTTASNNTGTLIASAVNALSGVDSAAEGAGTEQFTAAITSGNLGDTISGATAAVVGRDASEVPYLQMDSAAATLDAYFPSASEDDILVEEAPFTSYQDVESGTGQKEWSVKLRLVNDVSAY